MWWLEKCVLCCCWMKYSININETKLIERTIQVNCIRTDFLPASSINYWKGIAEASKCNNGFVYVLCYSMSFCLTCFNALLINNYYVFLKKNNNYYVFLENWPPFDYCNTLLVSFPVQKSALSDVNTATPAFFNQC